MSANSPTASNSPKASSSPNASSGELQVEPAELALVEDLTLLSLGGEATQEIISFPHQRLGKYELLELLGRGGMGEVWRARDTELGRIVALKRLNSTSAKGMARFRREANLIAQLSHPNIAQIFAFSSDPPFIAMQYIDGANIDRAGQPRVRALRDAALAVHEANMRGILHRDLKPANILVDRKGCAYVLDFGLACQREAEGETLSRTGDVLGTPCYMAPEQANGEINRIDARTDVYGLGATLYALLTGQPPHTGSSAYSIIRKVIEDEPRVPHGERDLQCIAMKALEKDPERRYPSARAFADDLTRYLEHKTIEARPASLAYRLRKRVRRHPLVTLLAGLLCMVSFAAAVYITSQWLAQGEMIAELQLRSQLEARGRELRSLEDALRRRMPARERQAIWVRLQRLEQELGMAIGEAPGEPALVFLLAHTRVLLHRYEDAHAAYSRCLDMPPSAWSSSAAIAPLAAWGRARIRLGRLVEHLLAHSPQGAARKKQQVLEELLPSVSADLERAGREAPQQTRDLASLWFQLARGQDSLVVVGARREIARGGETADFYLLLGLALSEMDQRARAEAFGASLALNWNQPGVLLRRGTAQLRQAEQLQADGAALEHVEGLFEAALLDYQAALELRPGFADALVNHSYTQVCLGRLDDALAGYSQAIERAPQHALAYLNRAYVLIELGDLHGAHEDLDTALWLEPDFLSAAYNRGHVKLRLGDSEGALEDFERCIELDPELADAWLQAGLVLRERGELQQAAGRIEQALKARPDFAEAYSDLGQIRAELGQHAAALEAFAQALGLRDDIPELFYNRGMLHFELGALRKARVDLDAAIRLQPGFPEAYLNRGLVRSRSHDLAGALVDYDQALALRPSYGEAYLNRSDVLIELGQRDAALADLNRALQYAPGSAEALVNRAFLRIELGELVAAQADCDRALELRPGLPEAWFQRGRARFGLGQLAAARADFDAQLAVQPEDLPGLVNRAVVLIELGELEAALLDCEAALALDPELAEGYFNRGLIRFERDQLEGARADFLAAARWAPDAVGGHLNLGHLDLHEGRVDDAIGHYDEVLQRWPNTLTALMGRGRAHTRRGDGEAALADFAAAEALDANHEDIYFYRARLWRAAGQPDKALPDLRRYLELETPHPEPLYLLIQIQLDRGEYEAALGELDHLLSIHPGSAVLLSYRASLRLDLGRFEAALDDASQLLELQPDNAEGYALRGDIQRARGALRAACDDYRRCLARIGEVPWRAGIETQLAELEAQLERAE